MDYLTYYYDYVIVPSARSDAITCPIFTSSESDMRIALKRIKLVPCNSKMQCIDEQNRFRRNHSWFEHVFVLNNCID